MSPAEALKAARTAGVEVACYGNDLLLKAASMPPTAVLDALSRHKAEIMTLLRPGSNGWSAKDWRVSRAGGGTSWRDQNWTRRGDPLQCAFCGTTDDSATYIAKAWPDGMVISANLHWGACEDTFFMRERERRQ